MSKLSRERFKVIAIFPTGNYVRVICPYWDPKTGIDIPISKFSAESMNPLKKGCHFFAKCDMECIDIETMAKSIQDLEPAPDDQE